MTKFINCVMERGKKSTAESIFYGALKQIEQKTSDDPLKTFKKALENVKPCSRSSRAASAARRTRCRSRSSPNRRTSLAIRWVIAYAQARGEKTMQEKLAGELLDAANNRGRRGEEEGRHPQDGRGQQGLRPLPLVGLHETPPGGGKPVGR